MNESADGGAPSRAPREPFALRARPWFWVPVLPLVALDLWTKHAVFRWLAERQPHRPPLGRRVDVDLLPDPFGFALVHWENTGTVWGIGQDFTGLLIGFRLVAVVVLVWIAGRTARAARLQLLTLGLILAGALGNLYDNLFMPGRAVRDFLLFYRERADGSEAVFPAFNVADSCITVGAIALLVLLWRDGGRTAQRAPVDGARAGA